MKFTIAATPLLLSSAAAFNAFGSVKPAAKSSFDALTVEDLPGILPPVGLFDPWNLGGRATPDLLRKYREAELTHGRVAMLATIGFLVGEAVEGSSFLFDASIKGPAITHFFQVPAPFWITLTVAIFAAEVTRAQLAFVDPADLPPQSQGKIRPDYVPGDLGFDPLGLKPEDADEFLALQNKELQNGRLAMLAAAGFLAQELADKKGIVEHLVGYFN